MKKSIYLIFALGLLLSLQSCMKEKNQETLRAPEIPPTSLFTIPTSSFGIVSEKESSEIRTDKSNWIHAGLNVLVWNTVVFSNTAVPIAAFGRAFDHDSKFIGEKTWIWKYDYTTPPSHGSKKYDVSLSGTISDDNSEVFWTMTVIDNANNKEFIWYEGTIDKDNTNGKFTFYKDPADPKPYMGISFTKEPSSNDLTIRFSNEVTSDLNYGDYIEWRSNNGSEFDRAYDIFTNNSLLEIQANSSTDQGRVKHILHFNDDNWHCWDETHDNIDCQ